jgi:rSAM/selenodomain-associated transferase 1
MMEECLLIVFFRAPVYGEVKSRLAQTLGESQALKVYQKLLSHTFKAAGQSGVAVRYFVDKAYPADLVIPIDPTVLFIQTGESLGERMAQAIDAGWDRYKYIVLVGTDIPCLKSTHIQEAFHLLHFADVVLGPAEDGGFYLIGMSQRCTSIFVDIPWSTDKTLICLQRQIEKWQLSYAFVRKELDIDTAGDLEYFLSRSKDPECALL